MSMEVKERCLIMLELDNGKVPFEEWLEKIKDKTIKQAVDARLTRIIDGNFGNYKSVGGGVFELKIPIGPGLRIYYGLEKQDLVVLICGGDKSTQRRDIEAAKTLWKQYKNEN